MHVRRRNHSHCLSVCSHCLAVQEYLPLAVPSVMFGLPLVRLLLLTRLAAQERLLLAVLAVKSGLPFVFLVATCAPGI